MESETAKGDLKNGADAAPERLSHAQSYECLVLPSQMSLAYTQYRIVIDSQLMRLVCPKILIQFLSLSSQSSPSILCLPRVLVSWKFIRQSSLPLILPDFYLHRYWFTVHGITWMGNIRFVREHSALASEGSAGHPNCCRLRRHLCGFAAIKCKTLFYFTNSSHSLGERTRQSYYSLRFWYSGSMLVPPFQKRCQRNILISFHFQAIIALWQTAWPRPIFLTADKSRCSWFDPKNITLNLPH